mmetsp:Transcript_27683/g.70507  ORF Transcript_27683/g.70507 Transcript_27683/m.70507 type:complete len:561 (-) Transcript_27683:519-2201(-)
MAGEYWRARCCSTPSATSSSASPAPPARAAAASNMRTVWLSAWLESGGDPAARATSPCTAWLVSHVARWPTASPMSSSLVCDTPSASRTSASDGSACSARSMAAMACWSSSFSACTVPSSRHASALFGRACTSASSASAASLSTPRLNKSLPLASAWSSPRKGLLAANTYWPLGPAGWCSTSCGWPSPYTRSHSLNTSSSPPPAKSPNSSAHVPALPLAAASSATCALHARSSSSSTPRSSPWLNCRANSSAHAPCALGPAAASAAEKSCAHCAPACAACGPTSTTLLFALSRMSSPFDILDTNWRNLEACILGSASRASTSSSLRVDAMASPDVAARCRSPSTASVACVNSFAHAPPGVCSSANSVAHAPGCCCSWNSCAHPAGPAACCAWLRAASAAEPANSVAQPVAMVGATPGTLCLCAHTSSQCAAPAATSCPTMGPPCCACPHRLCHSASCAWCSSAGSSPGLMCSAASSPLTCWSAKASPWSAYTWRDRMVALSRILHLSATLSDAAMAGGSGGGATGRPARGPLKKDARCAVTPVGTAGAPGMSPGGSGPCI